MAASAGDASPAAIAGQYDASRPEIAAYLELGGNGRFRYVLSYGALDEYSQGSWSSRDGAVVLKSDGGAPSRFEFLGQREDSAAAEGLTIHLTVPDGLPVGLFSVRVTREDGSASTADFAHEELFVPAAPAAPIASIQLALPAYDIAGAVVPVTHGRKMRADFVFRPNDFGFRVFDNAVMPLRDGAYVLDRSGLELRFRKVEN